MRQCTALTFFAGQPERRSEIVSLVRELDDMARESGGFIDSKLTSFDDQTLDWTLAVTFRSQPDLQAWLASPQREEALEQAETRNLLVDRQVLVMTEGAHPPPGVAVFSHLIATHSVGEFIALQRDKLAPAAGKFDGFVAVAIVPTGGADETWLSVVRFRTQPQLDAWLASSERAALVHELGQLLEAEFDSATSRTPFGATIRLVGGKPLVSPAWKIIMLVVLVLFPTVVIGNTLLLKLPDWGAVPPGVQMLAGQLLFTAAVSLVLMPVMSKVFRWWIDPVTTSIRATAAGVVLVTICYMLELGLFHLIPSLTPWAA